MKISYPVYIKPEGESVYELAQKIAKEKEEGKIGDKVFLSLPNGKDIELRGNTVSEIRDSIGVQCKYTRF
jgi:hypothetical protein